MKKFFAFLIVAAAALCVTAADVYTVKTSLKIPVYKTGAYWTYASKSYTGTLTIGEEGGVLEIAGTEYELTEGSLEIVAGKKDDSTGECLVFVATDGSESRLTLCGLGKIYSKKGGCTPCGEIPGCKKVYSASGNVTGLLNCGCGSGQHRELESDRCSFTEDLTTALAPVYGTWKMSLATVDGVKFSSWKKAK